MQYEVVVTLKKEVLDTQGRAIGESLVRGGFEAVEGVSVSKRFVLNFKENQQDTDSLVEKIASEFLANPVSETFEIRKL